MEDACSATVELPKPRPKESNVAVTVMNRRKRRRELEHRRKWRKALKLMTSAVLSRWQYEDYIGRGGVFYDEALLPIASNN